MDPGTGDGALVEFRWVGRRDLSSWSAGAPTLRNALRPETPRSSGDDDPRGDDIDIAALAGLSEEAH
jgi:hypothetical protein